MATVVLLSVSDTDEREFGSEIARACARAGVQTEFTGDKARSDPAFIVWSPEGSVDDFSVYPALRAVFSLWAGVERVVDNPTLSAPLCRMVDPGLTQGMVEYVLAHVLRYHLDLDSRLTSQDGVWRNAPLPRLAPGRRVGVLGLGALGGECARTLGALGFDVAGWSRRPRQLSGVVCYHGPEGLREVLRHSEILVSLLPQTSETEGLLDAATLAQLPRGARIINPGRGTLIDDVALLAALESDHIAHATLDVFRQEPLPADHPYWSHSRVTVTPHIAAGTRPSTAAPVIAENIRRAEAGEDLLHLVDRASGY